ncbi:hypothetical protein IG631_12138 [Alternaria alternata]|nr:hypothetical protein IG631_12138 [Alternaria alternata]
MTAVKRQGPLCSQVARGKRRAAVALGRPTVFLASGASRGRILPHDVLSIPEGVTREAGVAVKYKAVFALPGIVWALFSIAGTLSPFTPIRLSPVSSTVELSCV